MNAYYKKIGGRPEKQTKAAKGPGRKRKSMTEKKEPPAAPATENKRRRQSGPKTEAMKDSKAEDKPAESEDDDEEPSDWVPKNKDWEKEVSSVDTIIRDPTDQQLYALLLWNNGKRSRISIKSCYDNCPLKMLKFYEKHL